MLSTPSAENAGLDDLASPLAAARICASGDVPGGALEIWALRVSEVDVASLEDSPLNGEERRRAEKLARPGDRRRYLAAHLLLRQLLSRELGVGAHEITYVRRPCPHCGEPHGRPELSRSARPLHFSLAHSADVVLVGIAPLPVGVDVEALPAKETVDEVGALLHAAERREIVTAAPARRPAVFARLWTRKEAYLKGIGTGVTGELAAEYLGTDRSETAPSGWSVIDVPVLDGYAAAAAVSGPLKMSGGALQ